MPGTSLNVWGWLGSGSHSLITKNSTLLGRDEPSRPRALQTGERGWLLVRGRGAGGREPGRRKQPEEEEETQLATDDAGLREWGPRPPPPPAAPGAGTAVSRAPVLRALTLQRPQGGCAGNKRRCRRLKHREWGGLHAEGCPRRCPELRWGELGGGLPDTDPAHTQEPVPTDPGH